MSLAQQRAEAFVRQSSCYYEMKCAVSSIINQSSEVCITCNSVEMKYLSGNYTLKELKTYFFHRIP